MLRATLLGAWRLCLALILLIAAAQLRAQDAYLARIAMAIKDATVVADVSDIAGNPLVEYSIDLFPDGSLRSVTLLRSSGAPVFDRAVRRAIENAAPYPANPATGKVPPNITIVHRLRDTAAAAPAKPPPTEERRRIEDAQPAPPQNNREPQAQWVWPAQGKLIRKFDPVFKGIDIEGQLRQPVVAAGSGTVLHAKYMRGYGNLVILNHEGGLVSAYAHNHAVLVSEGQWVNKGQVIADMGSSDADSVRLHFEVRLDGKPVDPLAYLPAQEPGAHSVSPKPALANNSGRNELEQERQQLADERRKLDEERRQRDRLAVLRAEERRRAEQERRRIEEDRRRVDEDRRRMEEERRRFDEARRRADDERKQREKAERQADSAKNNAAVAADARRRLALVIGNAAYNNAPLRNPVNDANLIAGALSASGFTVARHENLSYAKMREAVRLFSEKLGKGDVVLFYFSGHAVQYRGKNYLLPVNEDIRYADEIPSSALDMDFVLAKMESSQSDLNIVVLDACRNNPVGVESRALDRGLVTMNAAKGSFIAFATSPGKVAFDGTGSSSPYSKNLAQAILAGGLTLEQVFKEVRRNVIAETNSQQVPWENSSVLGDFYFK